MRSLGQGLCFFCFNTVFSVASFRLLCGAFILCSLRNFVVILRILFLCFAIYLSFKNKIWLEMIYIIRFILKHIVINTIASEIAAIKYKRCPNTFNTLRRLNKTTSKTVQIVY